MATVEELNEQLERECFNYPPDFEKMQELVDAGADVNASYDEYQSLLGNILGEYLERMVTRDYTIYLEMGAALICEKLCGGEKVLGRDGRYIDSIVRFFFDNGFDMKKTLPKDGTTYAQDLLWNVSCVFHGPDAMKTLRYILSFVTTPAELYDYGGCALYIEYESSGWIDYHHLEYPRYGCCQYKAGKIVRRFIKEKGWDAEFKQWEEEHMRRDQ